MRTVAGLLAGVLLLGGCAVGVRTQAPAKPTAEVGTQAQWEAAQAAYLAWNAHRPGWRVTPSGLQYRCVQHGPKGGPQPQPGATVTLHYTGTFIDGRKFDSSRDRGEPATFPLGRLIKGWQEGVPMMHVGDRCLFAIPADLAYGSRYREPIPPNSALLFDIELIAIPDAQ